MIGMDQCPTRGDPLSHEPNAWHSTQRPTSSWRTPDATNTEVIPGVRVSCTPSSQSSSRSIHHGDGQISGGGVGLPGDGGESGGGDGLGGGGGLGGGEEGGGGAGETGMSPVTTTVASAFVTTAWIAEAA